MYLEVNIPSAVDGGGSVRGPPNSAEHIQIHILFSGFRSKSKTYEANTSSELRSSHIKSLKFGSEHDKHEAKKSSLT